MLGVDGRCVDDSVLKGELPSFEFATWTRAQYNQTDFSGNKVLQIYVEKEI